MIRRDALAAWQHVPWLLWAMYGLVLGGYALGVPSLAQDPTYHDFADVRGAWGIPNFGDVVSNAALLLAGLGGLLALRGRGQGPRGGTADPMHALFFGAVTLTAVGSAYYHWAPDSPRLFWDRLPLGLVASAFPAMVLTDRVAVRGSGRVALASWLALGPAAVVYWHIGARTGAGDLRPYFVLQAVAMAGALALLALLPPRHTRGGAYLLAVASYAAAVVFEQADRAVFETLRVLSGHTLKHIAAGLAVAALAWMVAGRRALAPGS